MFRYFSVHNYGVTFAINATLAKVNQLDKFLNAIIHHAFVLSRCFIVRNWNQRVRSSVTADTRKMRDGDCYRKICWNKQTNENDRASFAADENNARLLVHCHSRSGIVVVVVVVVVVLRILFSYLSLRVCATRRGFRVACQIFLPRVASRTHARGFESAQAHNRER